ncbi:hypothetical protein VTK56DRAFT_6952 [Thermocarpiscus australiensis]
MIDDNATSDVIDISQYDTQGFCPGYTLRRHRYESLANAGCHEARQDWIQYIGPVSEFGNCNPVNGNFTAVVLPLCKPERLRLVAYVIEYAFIHDNVVEVIQATSGKNGDAFTLGEQESTRSNVKSGRKQIQAKMMLQLTATDRKCAERVMDVWTTMLSTTLKDKARNFKDLEDYLDFRIIDTGALFVESLMLFGMEMTLTKDEDAMLAGIVRPCYASLALTNDYFSFDIEYLEAQQPGGSRPVNAVWLFMQWYGVNVSVAKRLVRTAANRYERDFLDRCEQFRSENPGLEKLHTYLRALSYQVSGNVVWSLNCPRYNPAFRYDPNAGLEDRLTSIVLLMDSSSTNSDDGTPCSWERASSRCSSISRDSLVEDGGKKASFMVPAEQRLGFEHLTAPFQYTKALPSKGVRDTLVDALNLWAELSEDTVAQIKGLIDHLHTASLMLDDIQDGSDLRRGRPAAHTLFGVPQTLNAATFAIVEALGRAKDLNIPWAVDIAIEQLQDLHVGQSYDLYWTRHNACPSEEEYLEMVSKKTGGLFRLLSRLMTYTNQKGFCEDLDEGKMSFPLVHYLNTQADSLQLREIMQRRKEEGRLTVPLKRLALQLLKDSGSTEYTRDALKRLEGQIDRVIERLEASTGRKNWVLRLCMQKLSV